MLHARMAKNEECLWQYTGIKPIHGLYHGRGVTMALWGI